MHDTSSANRELVSDRPHSARAVEEGRILLLPTEDSYTESDDLVSQSPAMLPVFHAIARAAPTDYAALIVGEPGTGKELVARSIHRHSPRAAGPFVAFPCGGIPEDLLDGEWFGHEGGAFPGAATTRIGRIERASGGTLFLDEIGDASPRLQAKLLRAIEDRAIERVGGWAPIAVDVRFIAAVHRDPAELIREGRLREDLHARLAAVTIRVPPLVERGDDLFLLAARYLRAIGGRYGKRFTGISEDAWRRLRGHPWPGNVRELRNTIERAVLAEDGPVLRAESLPDEWGPRPNDAAPAPGSHATLREVETAYIRSVLERTGGRIGAAARILGVHRNTLTRKLKAER